jgi:hypothetical protein
MIFLLGTNHICKSFSSGHENIVRHICYRTGTINDEESGPDSRIFKVAHSKLMIFGFLDFFSSYTSLIYKMVKLISDDRYHSISEHNWIQIFNWT